MEAIQTFINHLKFEKRYSKHSLVAYQTDLAQFAAYLKDQYSATELREIQATFIRSWLVKLMENGLDPRSINRKISTLKSFYKFALKSGWVDVSPMGKISSPKVPKRLPVYVEAEKLDNLLDNEEFKFPDDFNGMRDHLIIELFYGTGMRLSELIGLDIGDVDLRQRQLKVTGKRNKQRIIPLFPALAEQISKYLEQRNAVSSAVDSLLILENGKTLYPGFVYRLVKEKLSLISTQEKRSPHVLRHSFATEMLNKGAELNAIKEILGHANLSATQVYTHNTIEKLKETYKKAHPRA
jgi:integrase/recombinase XerC